MQTTLFIERLKKALPESSWSRVIAALRQDPIVWEALQSPNLQDLTLKYGVGEPDIWSPAFVSLASLKRPLLIKSLRSSRPQKIDDRLRHQAAAAYEDLSKVSDGAQFPRLSIEHAGLLALAMLERKLRAGTWDELANDLKVLPLAAWRTPLACLYGMIAQPNQLLEQLLASSGSTQRFGLILHILLSNPLPRNKQIEALNNLIDPLGAEDQLVLLRQFAEQQPKGAKLLARKILSGAKAQDLKGPANLKQVNDLIQRAEMYQIAGKYAQAHPLLESAWEISHQLQTGLIAKLARSAAKDKDSETAIAAIQAIEKSSPGATEDSATTTLARLQTGQLIPPPGFDPATNELIDNHHHPANLLTAARLAQRSGDRRQAQVLAHQALQAALDAEGSFSEPLEYLHPLVDLLLDINLPHDAARAAEQGLATRANDPELLASLSKAYLMSGQVEDGVQAAHVLTALQPKDLEARRQLVAALSAANQWQVALDEMEVTIARQSEPLVEDLCSLASCALHLDQPQRAAKACQQVILKDPKSGKAHALFGEALLQLGDHEEALKHLQQATRLIPTEPAPWLALADFYQHQAQSVKAIEALEAAVKSAPEAPELHLALGLAYRQEDAIDEALIAFTEASNLIAQSNAQPNELPQRIALELGRTQHQFGEIKNACKTLEQAHQAYPTNPDLAHAYAKTLLALNDPSGALSALSIAVEAKPNSQEVLIDYAEAQMAHEEHLEQAVNTLQDVFARDPENKLALALLAEATAKSGQQSKALDLYQRALEAGTNSQPQLHVRLCLGLSDTALALEQPDVAIAAMKNALQVAPDDPTILKRLAQAYQAAGLPQNAWHTLQDIRSTSPDDAETLAWFAKQAIALGKHEKGIEALQRAYQLAPDQPEILLDLGRAQLHAGTIENAKETLAKLQQCEQTQVDHLRHAAKALQAAGEVNAALPYVHRAVEIDSDPSTELLGELFAGYRQTGNYDAALATADTNIKRNPHDPNPLVSKASLLIEMGRPQAALACLEHALQLKPNQADLHYQAALILRQSSDLISALDHATRAINIDAQSLSNRYLAADTLRACLRPMQAKKMIEDADWSAVEQTLAEIGLKEQETFTSRLNATCLRAELALETGEEIRAAEIIAPALELASAHPRLLAIQSRLAQRRGDLTNAEEILKSLLETLSNDETSIAQQGFENANTLTAIAQAALESKHWDTALYFYRQAVAGHSFEPLPQLEYAQALVLRAEYQRLCQSAGAKTHAPGENALSQNTYEAFQIAMMAARRHAPFEDSHKEILHWQARGRDVFEPESHNQKQEASLYPETPSEVATRLSALRLTGQYEIAKQVAKQHPEHPDVLMQLALISKNSDPSQAFMMASKATSSHPDNPLYHALTAQFANEAGEYDAALNAIERALSQWEDEPCWRRLAAEIQSALGNGAEAVAHLELATQLAPEEAAHHQALGKAYLRNGASESAILALEKATTLDTGDADSWLALAEAHLRANHLAEAARCAQEAMKIAPRQHQPLLLSAEIALQANEPLQASSFVQAAMKLKPKDAKAILLKARALHELGKDEEAIAALERTLEFATQSVSDQLARAKLLQQVKGKQAGLDTLKEVVRNHPDHLEVQVTYAQALSEAGHRDQAIKVAQQAARLDVPSGAKGTQSQVHHMLGKMLFEAGQLDQAIHHLGQSLQLVPEDLETCLDLARVFCERRQHDKALELFKKAMTLAPSDSRPYQGAAQALKDIKDYAGAESMLRQAAALAPKNVEVQRQLGAIVALNLVHHPKEAAVDA